MFHLGLRQRVGRPLSETPQALGKRAFAVGTVRFPHAPLHVLAEFTKGFLRSIPDFDTRMEKAQDHRDPRKQSFPSVLRGLPAIRIDGFRGMIGIQGLRFPGKHAIGVL